MTSRTTGPCDAVSHFHLPVRGTARTFYQMKGERRGTRRQVSESGIMNARSTAVPSAATAALVFCRVWLIFALRSMCLTPSMNRPMRRRPCDATPAIVGTTFRPTGTSRTNVPRPASVPLSLSPSVPRFLPQHDTCRAERVTRRRGYARRRESVTATTNQGGCSRSPSPFFKSSNLKSKETASRTTRHADHHH